MSAALYPNERAALRVLVTTDQPTTVDDITRRLHTGAAPRKAVGVAAACETLTALGYADIVDRNAGRPISWRVTSFGRLAWEQLA